MPPYPTYLEDYAKRHRIPLHMIQKSEMLRTAAIYERQVQMKLTKLVEARRAFTKEYPKTKTLQCVCKKDCPVAHCKLIFLNLIKGE